MTVYEITGNKMCEQLKTIFPGAEVIMRPVRRIGQAERHAIFLREAGEKASRCVYIEDLLRGKPYTAIFDTDTLVKDAAEVFRAMAKAPAPPELTKELLLKTVVPAIIRREGNEDVLAEYGFEGNAIRSPLPDTAVLLVCLIDGGGEDVMVMELPRTAAEDYGIELDELEKAACTNAEAILEHASLDGTKGGIRNAAVLSNTYRLFGSGTIAVRAVRDKVADAFGGAYYILPSSVHELILFNANQVGKKKVSLNEMKKMVSISAQDESVGLTGNVYRLEPGEDTATLV